jgi:hypothetical protein
VFPDLSRDSARAQLEPFHEKFIAAIKEAVRLFNTIDPPLLYRLVKWKRVKANAMWGFIVEEIENTFRDTAGIRVVKRQGSIEIEVGENTVARVKKMRPDGFTANYMTARVTEFHTADQGELFAEVWARPMRLDIGYIEDETGTQVAKIMVARRWNPGRIHWTYEMTPPADGDVLPFPVDATTPVAPADDSRIVARESENAKPNTAQGTDDE